MDGNGRWARARGLARIRGHEKGVESIRDIVTECARIDEIEYLTLYAFSRENWRRPRTEVNYLMRLLKRFCRRELKTMMDNSVRFTTIGATSGLPQDVERVLRETAHATAANERLTLCLALNYGARDEIIRAVRRVAREAAAGGLAPKAVTEETFGRYLDTAKMPDPDLIIRTAGEKRLSNFLLWQASYAELWFTDVLWPDFRKEHLADALREYSQRTRRFGGIEDVR